MLRSNNNEVMVVHCHPLAGERSSNMRGIFEIAVVLFLALISFLFIGGSAVFQLFFVCDMLWIWYWVNIGFASLYILGILITFLLQWSKYNKHSKPDKAPEQKEVQKSWPTLIFRILLGLVSNALALGGVYFLLESGTELSAFHELNEQYLILGGSMWIVGIGLISIRSYLGTKRKQAKKTTK